VPRGAIFPCFPVYFLLKGLAKCEHTWPQASQIGLKDRRPGSPLGVLQAVEGGKNGVRKVREGTDTHNVPGLALPVVCSRRKLAHPLAQHSGLFL